MSYFSRKLLWFAQRTKKQAEIREELQFHLEEEIAERREAGLPLHEAQRAARLELGNRTLIEEETRAAWIWTWVDQFGRDLRYALCLMRRSPGFTAVAVLSLALGIGANAALFSFVNAILLKHLQVPQPARLVILKKAGESLRMSYQRLNELNRQATAIEGLMGTYPLDVSLILGDSPQWISAELVTGGYFQVLKIKAERGRLLTQRDLDDAEGDPTCVISYRLWQNQFGGSEAVLGQTILLNTHRYTIVGVSERGFTGSDLQRPTDIDIPATRLIDYMPAFVGRRNFDWKSRLSLLCVIARLKPGEGRTGAASQLDRLDRIYLESAKLGKPSTDIQLSDGSAGLQSLSKLAEPASILTAVSSLVLLIACANLATLLLSRTSARSSEFALRLAIGGSRRQILAQVLVESSLLALFGTMAGIAVAYAIEWVLLWFLNRTTPEIHQLHVSLDGTVLLFVTMMSAMCVVIFGAAPAIQAARTAALGSSAGNTRTGVGLRKTFVVVQIALSFLVVLSAGLLTGTLRNLKAVNLGFNPDQITAIDIRPAAGGYSGAQADQFYKQIVERIRTLPRIEAAATAFGLNLTDGFKVKIDPLLGSGTAREVSLIGVTGGYFDVFGARILAGRDFDAGDTADKGQVYIISEHLAKSYFKGENPIGRYLQSDGGKLRVVGVVSDVRDQGPRETSMDNVYQDIGQLLASNLTVFVRCHGLCAPVLSSVRKAIRDVDPNTPILSMRTLQTEIEGAFSSQEMLGFLSMLFAGLAMLLVAVGIYGILSYALTRRTREMGIRIALGASGKDIVWIFVSEVGAMIIVGSLIGLPAALAAVTFLRAQLFGIEPHDPMTLAACVLCILVTILLASVAPIRRALHLAPHQALRVE